MLKRNINGGNTNNMWGWGTFWLVLAVAYFVSMLCGFRQANAISGDPEYWTDTGGGLTITLVSMQQNGVDIDPEWSDYLWNEETGDFGAYYFPTFNNGDPVRCGIKVEGMQEGEQYQLFYSEIVTAADNGKVFYKEMTPSAIMGDAPRCTEDEWGSTCYGSYLVNEYTLDASLHKVNDWSDFPQLRLLFRPQSVGSSMIEVTSVKQGDDELVLDRNGRQTADIEAPHMINEYQLVNYNEPVTISYKLKGLQVGQHYSLNVGDDYSSFTADATEITGVRTVPVNTIRKHLDLHISLYGSEGSYVPMYFVVTDPDFVPLGDIIVDEVRQGGNEIAGELDEEAFPRTYGFEANDVENLEIALHSVRTTRDMDYYITSSLNSHQSGSTYRPAQTVRVSGEELELGTVITVPARYGESDKSPFDLNIYVSAVDNQSYSNVPMYYKNYGEDHYNSDVLSIVFHEDATIPRYTGSLGYENPAGADAPGIFEGIINAEFHDEDNPLKMRIEGENYVSGNNYNVVAKVTKVDFAGGEQDVYERTFAATGAELNSGKEFILNDLVLHLPVFDPDVSLSAYDSGYHFSVDINGLEQSGDFFYMYNGWGNTVVTYDGGRVSAAGAADGIGAAGPYISVNMSAVKRSSLDGSKQVIIHYVGEGFDDDASYEYDLYYNSSVDAVWSSSAGVKIENGVMLGSALNAGEFSVNVRVPDSNAQSATYTLVVKRNGGVVKITREDISFVEGAMIEAFRFEADDDSFMQTGRSNYRMAVGTDATAILVGSEFDDAEQYKLWVNYTGYRTEQSEYGSYGAYVDLAEFNTSVVMTGAELNAGYRYAVNYEEAFSNADSINVDFQVTDVDAVNPANGIGMGGMSLLDATGGQQYPGHYISIEYVPTEEVFNDHGYQIDEETSDIIDVSRPELVSIHDMTANEASVETDAEAGTMTVITQKPVTVVGVRNGSYVKVTAESYEDVGGGTRNLVYNLANFEELYVVLKGDGNMDGRISISDSNMINKSKVSPTLERVYRPLSDIEKIVLDLNNNGSVTIADSTIINKSLVSESLTNIYQPIAWD
mgnify:CR=1 FL=1